EIDDDAAVAHRITRQAMSAAAYRDQQVLRSGAVDGTDHVRGARASRDERGMLVEGAVPDATRGIVPVTRAGQHRTALLRTESVDIRGLDHDGVAAAGHRGYVRRLGGAGEARSRKGSRGRERDGAAQEVSSFH